MTFDWNSDKDKLFKFSRGVHFELIVKAILKGRLLADLPHPNQVKYPKQRYFVVLLKKYAYVTPYVQNKTKIFLKTIYPSHKYYKQYVKNAKNKI